MRFCKTLSLTLLATGSLFASQVAIGNLGLQYNSGYQEVTFSNFTGLAGCTAWGAPYSVCSEVDVSSWSLTITFAPQLGYSDSTPASPWTLSGTDTIGPYDGSNPYVGGVGGAPVWAIPLSGVGVLEPDCPPCDYQISQLVFSGTLSLASVPFRIYNGSTYDGADPSTYSVFNAKTTFSTTWNVSSNIYSFTGTGGLVYGLPGWFPNDSGADVLVDEQNSPPPTPGVPEPGSLLLMAAGLAAACLLKRLSSLSAK